jgi:hypothetical protein
LQEKPTAGKSAGDFCSSFVCLVFFLESSPRPIALQACESRIQEVPGQGILAMFLSYTPPSQKLLPSFAFVYPF